jgi:hypothetical protein
MNYNNYERNIVERHSLAMVGWPSDLLPIRNPSLLGGREQVHSLLNALVNKTCHWTVLTEEQLTARVEQNHARQAAGELVYKPRKKRVMQASKKLKSAPVVEDDNETELSEMDTD